MRCLSPFFNRSEKIPLPCGKCFFCRRRKANQWTGRLLMENFSHAKASFLTLTFDDDHLPNPPYVSKRDLQLFFKRLRKSLSPRKFRYYACAEYGDTTGRPHYHAILFGISQDEKDVVSDAWKMGYVRLDRVQVGSIAYVAGYVNKKFIHSREFEITGEVKEKEFSLMSRRPALGSNFLNRLKDLAFSQAPHDVISVIQVGERTFLLDRTMREKLRKLVLNEEEYESVKKVGKELYALGISERLEEKFGSAVAEDYLNFFREEKSFLQDILYFEEKIGLALEDDHDALKEEERIMMKKLVRSKI